MTPPRVTVFQIRNFTPIAVSFFWTNIWTRVHIFMDVENPSTPNNCVQISRCAFLKVFDSWGGNTMQVYWLTDRTNGETNLVDGDTVERLLGVEIGYVEWCIRIDRVFENGRWRVDCVGLIASALGGLLPFAAAAKVFSQFP